MNPSGASRTTRADATANRARILAAAQTVFARRGLDAEVREIAEHAGVGVGTLYRHFESREGLLAALKETSKAALERRLLDAMEADDPAEGVRAMVRIGAEACERFGALAEALLSGALDEAGDDHTHFTSFLVHVLERGMRKGAFREDLDVPVAVAFLESTFTSGALWRLATERSFGAAADAISDLFLTAIRAPRTAERSA